MNSRELDFVRQFDELRPELLTWAKHVDEQLISKVLASMIREIKIEPKFRVKEQRSLIEKAFYRYLNFKNPITEIVDKVGTRVVFLKTDDVTNARDLILNAKIWKAEVTKNTDDEIADKPKVFDYQSVHIVVYPLTQLGKFLPDAFGCEIQLRTLLQHAFAEVSHDNVYKGVYQNDPTVLRQLSKSMALMEATDDYFKTIYETMIDETRAYPAFLTDLAKIYKEFVPAFTKDKLNVSLNDKFLALFKAQPVSIQDIRTLIQKRVTEFNRAIKASNGYLFQQPVSILIGYYLLRNERFLNENWPVDSAILTDVYRAFNISQANY